MINKTQQQGPEHQGLLQKLLGSKGDAAQAETSAESGVDATSKSPEEFIAALMQAQDQKDAKTANQAPQVGAAVIKRTKGGQTGKVAQESDGESVKTQTTNGKQQRRGVGQAEVSAQEQAAALAALLQAQGLRPDPNETRGDVPATTPVPIAVPMQGRTGPPVLRAQPAQLETATGVVPHQSGPKVAQVPGGVPGISSREELNEAVAAAQQAAIAAQRAAISSQDATIKAHEALAGAQSQARAGVTLQPIVIQTPLAIPVEVVEVDDDGVDGGVPMGAGVLAGREGGRSPLVSSQDFLAQLSQGRHGGGGAGGQSAAFGADGFDWTGAEDRFAKGSHDVSGDRVAMLVPSVGGHQAAHDTTVAAAPLELTRTSGGRTEIADTVALAGPVDALAARGGGSIRMKIVPESLGEVTIHVKNEGGRLDVHFEAQSHVAREALQAAMPELRQVLSAARYDVRSLEVGGRAAGSLFAAARDGSAVAASTWAQESRDWGGQQGSQHEWHGEGNAWERWFGRQERQQQRDQRAYDRYQEAMGS